MIDHRTAETLMATAIDFPLTPDEQASLDGHLAGCDRCRLVATQLRREVTAIEDMAAEDAPLRVRTTVEAAALQASAPNPRFILLLAAAFLMALMVGGAIVLNGDFFDTDGLTVNPSPSGAASSSPTVSDEPAASPVTAGTWTATGDMDAIRSGHTATLLPDGTVLVAGGCCPDDAAMASAELYDPESGSWSATGTMHEARHSHTATRLSNGSVLVTGGSSFVIDPPPLASAELYDPTTRSWTATGQMIRARYLHSATLLRNGLVLVAGGGPSAASAELYDPAEGTWTTTGDMVAPRTGHTATLLDDGSVLVVGGLSDGGAVATAELYDPHTGLWTATGGMLTPRSDHAATLLPDGDVLVVGGGNPSEYALASAELYDPDSGLWTVTGSMAVTRAYPTATVLTNGTVLVAGGTDASYGALASAELYDVRAGTWTAAAAMNAPRSGHSATLLANGLTLVAGGSNQTAGALYLAVSGD